MSSYVDHLLQRNLGRGLLVDTNLLLLYAIGTYDESIIERHAFNRLAAYTVEDLQLLRGLFRLFSTHVTTPHVLTEVSNWIGHLPRKQEEECLQKFGAMFADFNELSFSSLELAAQERFRFLGLTDSAIATVAAQYLVLTDDARFVFHLNQMGHEALNINHIRQEIWLRDS